MSRSRHPRLVVYSQDGLGLGHQRRTTLLVNDFLAARPGASALTISDSPLGQFFATGQGHDYLKLPSIHKLGPGDWRPLSLSLSFQDVLKMRRKIIRTAALTYNPDVVLVDHMPHGAMGELVPTLDALKSTSARVILGLRDILDAPITIRQRWRLEGAFDAIERHFHEVLVYGSRDVFDVSAEYDFPPRVARLMRYCGYVCSSPADPSPVEKVRRRYLRNDPGAELIVAMAGGGADADALFKTLVRAVPAINAQRRCVVVIVTGPFLSGATRRKLLKRAEGLSVHIIPSVHDSLTYLTAADFVVAMAGYNTTAEILSLDRPALLVPRAGPSAEQQMRSRLFAERGWVSWLPPERLSAPELAAEILRGMAIDREASNSAPDLGGRGAATQRLLDERPTALMTAVRRSTDLTRPTMSPPAPDAERRAK